MSYTCHPFIINLLHQKRRFNILSESLSFIRKRVGTDALCVIAVFQHITLCSKSKNFYAPKDVIISILSNCSKILPENLALVVKSCYFGPDNARLSIILIQSLFLIKERYFHFFRFPLRFKLSFKLSAFYFYRIFHILSFLFLRTLTITFRHMKKWHNLSQDYKAYLFSLIRRYNRCINFY